MGNWTASAWPILVSAALKSTLVLGVAWLMAGSACGRSAAARHVVWTACAAASLALPLLSISLPVLHLRAANAVLPADADAVVFRERVRDGDGHGGGGGARAGGPGSAGAGGHKADWRAGIVVVWAAGSERHPADADGVLRAVAGAARRGLGVRGAGRRLGARLRIEEDVRILEILRDADDVRRAATNGLRTGVR